MNSALDELVKPENWNKSSMAWRGEGYPADVAEVAAAQLVELRAALRNAQETAAVYAANNSALMVALDEARNTITDIEEYWNGHTNERAMIDALEHIEKASAAWLEKWEETP